MHNYILLLLLLVIIRRGVPADGGREVPLHAPRAVAPIIIIIVRIIISIIIM